MVLWLILCYLGQLMPNMAAEVSTKYCTLLTRTDIFLLQQGYIGCCVVIAQPKLIAVFGSMHDVHRLVVAKGDSIHHRIKRKQYDYYFLVCQQPRVFEKLRGGVFYLQYFLKNYSVLGIFRLFIVRYMDKSDQYDGSIAEEQKIIAISQQEEEKQEVNKKVKFATVNQIKKWERATEIQNKKIMDQNPTLFDASPIDEDDLHFVWTEAEQYFLVADKKEQAEDIISKGSKKWDIKIDIPNIRIQSTLRIELAHMKRNRILAIESCKGKKAIGYRYTLRMGDGTVALRIWIELQGEYKIWKQMQIPAPQQSIILQIQSFNHEQTDIKINDFIFHLILKMPYWQQARYSLLHENCAQLKKIEVKLVKEQRDLGESETNCSNECQLI